MPFFSVIIPLYNKEYFIINTLQSVLAQTFSDFEILLINDGSTDESEAVAKTITDHRIRFFNKENGGVSTARNFGISQAKSSYITFLDADDYWYPDFLQTMRNLIEKFPEQKVFAGAIEIETSKNVMPGQYSIQKTAETEIVDYFEASEKESVIFTSCAVFHESVFEKVGVFDPEIRSGQDIDLWIRIGLEFPVLFTWKVLTKYVYDPKSLSKNKSYTSTKLNFSKFGAFENQRPALKKYLDLNRFSMAIKSKITGDMDHFKKFSDNISKENLTLKKKILLQMPGWILRFMVKLNHFLVDLGLMSTVFR